MRPRGASVSLSLRTKNIIQNFLNFVEARLHVYIICFVSGTCDFLSVECKQHQIYICIKLIFKLDKGIVTFAVCVDESFPKFAVIRNCNRFHLT